MQIKKNLHIIITVSVAFLVLYAFFAARSLSHELQLTPQWTTSIFQTPQEKNDPSQIQLPFRLGQNMGYFTTDGQITLMESFPFQAAISTTYRTTYAPDSTRIPVYQLYSDRQGTSDFHIEEAGFPYICDDRIYILTPGGYGLSQYTTARRLWQCEHSAPITTISSTPSGTAVGYADGMIFIFSATGELLQTFEPGGSTYPIILGTALSPSASQLACVSGIDQQRFVLTQQRNGVNKVVFHTYLEGNLREPVLVQFSQDESKVFYSSAIGIGIVDCTTFANTTIPLKGKVLSIQESHHNNLIAVLTKDKNRYNIYLMEMSGTFIGSFGFQADSAFITIEDGDLFVGRDTFISKINLDIK